MSLLRVGKGRYGEVRKVCPKPTHFALHPLLEGYETHVAISARWLANLNRARSHLLHGFSYEDLGHYHQK